MSDIRFNQWLHQSGTGGVSQDHIGNIGIGTTNPSIVVSAANTAVLNVGVITANNLFVNNAFNGDITGNVTGNISGATGTFSGNVDIADKIIHTGDTDTAMRFPADNTFAVDTAGSERLRITSDGQIGMGIASPTQESGTGLHIRGANGGQTRIHLTNSDTGDTATDGFYIISQGAESGGASGEVMLQQKENKALKFATNSTERLRITSAGLVGVNCTPLSQFQVKAATNANIALTAMGGEAAIEAFNDAGSANVALRLRGSEHKFFIGSTERLLINSAGNIGMSNDMTGGGGAYARLTVQMPTQSGGSGIQVANSSNGSGDGTTSNIVLRSVNNDCSQWAGAEYRASDHIFAIQGTEKIRINSDGRLLINATNNPTLGGQTPYLRVNGGYTNLDGLRIRGLDTGNTIWKDGGDMSLTVASAHSIYFKTQSATALQVTANGQVLTSLQPRFLARLTANTTYNPSGFGNHVDFDTEDYDIGGNFTTSGADQGLFTAPISGMYAFSAASYAPGTNQTQSWFVVNSSRKVATDWVPNQQGSFVQNFQIIYLSTGDKVGFHPHSAGTGYQVHANTHHTYFKGCLLG